MSTNNNRKNERPLAQWSFLQYKKTSRFGSSIAAPVECFLHSGTQIGSKILYYGGSNLYGEPLSQLYIYDTNKQSWNSPTTTLCSAHDQDPGPRYGHSATLIGMHPPKIMIWGGIINAGTYEFDAPDGMDNYESTERDTMSNKNSSSAKGGQENSRQFMSWRRQGKKLNIIEEMEDSVYFLELAGDSWQWSKPLIHSTGKSKPASRVEHSACKTSTNEIMIFGGWTSPYEAATATNDVWSFNIVDMEWKQQVTSGIQPRARYRHTSEIVGTKMYIFGGSDTAQDIADGCNYLNIHELDLETLQWSHPVLTGTNPFPRSGHASAVVGANTVAIFGGKRNNQVYLNDIVLIDLSTFVCTTINVITSQLPTPISNATLSAIGNKVYVFGGTDCQGHCYDGIRELNIAEYLDSADITVAQGLSSDYCFKILIIGDASVGKSALLTRFSENAFLPSYTATLGIDFSSRMIRVEKAICKLEIWDTAGQERFATITANYYRGAQGALVVYDVTERASFDHAITWFERARQLGGENLITVLIGNKTDLPSTERQVSYEEGQSLADRLGIGFMETSALNGDNVENAFVAMSVKIKGSVDRRGLTGMSGVKGTALTQTARVEVTQGDKKQSSCGCT